MTTVEILEGALAKLRTDGWVKFRPGGYDEPACLVGCIAFTAWPSMNVNDYRAELAAMRLLGRLTGCNGGVVPLARWNDAPERTVQDVEALLTAAIQIASEQEAGKEIAYATV